MITYHNGGAHHVELRDIELLEVIGPTIQVLTPLDVEGEAPCLMRGTIPPGVCVPLHSHRDPETFLVVSGAVEGLQSAGGLRWTRIKAGDIFHVPGDVPHAFRNPRGEPAVMLLTSTARMGRFFCEVGVPIAPASSALWPPSAERVRHFMETAARYGYWNATPEENARIGLALQAAG